VFLYGPGRDGGHQTKRATRRWCKKNAGTGSAFEEKGDFTFAVLAIAVVQGYIWDGRSENAGEKQAEKKF
jgi:hypothetical protein